MAPRQPKNFVQHVLTVAALSTDVTLTWDSVSGWPTVGDFALRLDNPANTLTEYYKVTSVNVGANQTTGVRAQEGTGASAFPINSTGGNDLTAQMLTDGFARLDVSSVAALGNAVTPPGRYVGNWSTFGAPTGLTAILNDYGLDGNNAMWICTVAGTPGTWRTLPLGTLANGYQEITAGQSGIVAAADITGLSCPVTVGSGRRVRTEGYCGEFDGSVAGDIFIISLAEDGATIASSVKRINAAAPTLGEFVSIVAFRTPTAGAHTYKVVAQRSTGTGTGTFNAAASNKGFIHVEDVGV